MGKVEVTKGEFNALNAWYANGYGGLDLVRTYIGCRDEGLTFKDPYLQLTYMGENKILKIAAAGVRGYEVMVTTEDKLLERYKEEDEDGKRLMKWVIDTMGDYVEGITD